MTAAEKTCAELERRIQWRKDRKKAVPTKLSEALYAARQRALVLAAAKERRAGV